MLYLILLHQLHKIHYNLYFDNDDINYNHPDTKIGELGMDAFDVNFDMVVGKRISTRDAILKEE